MPRWLSDVAEISVQVNLFDLAVTAWGPIFLNIREHFLVM